MIKIVHFFQTFDRLS
ncbi:Protein of unknown function [Pyronema omphalodes CBS 100304]|uniref:Uncharacterized protein n=1 Tax=Pyronema omphalodes (strain CBS 100304) TaxID=1076935 RepID=U4LT43_PYROM|nr:Protein of unknown function [Pyronema omphalodes CBS 100304]